MNPQNDVLVDANATKETLALFKYLQKTQDTKNVIFGQQDATVYGRIWKGDDNRSDVKDICGKHPALLGLDFHGLETRDSASFVARHDALVEYTKEAYQRGNIITYCWHMPNVNNGGSFYWKYDSIVVVPHILPGGKLHDEYKRYLNVVGQIASEFRGANDELIPVIFRPFHEFDGDWFWWGKGHTSKEEFISLWQFTVDYLKDTLGVHNFIYAFSPDCRFTTPKEYLAWYPGDEYVDILGMDNYHDFNPDGANDPESAAKKLKIVADLANEKNKVAALTETGLEGVSIEKWYTEILMPILLETNIAYVQVWRNAFESETHYYVPVKGHAAEKDFVEFSNHPNMLFDTDIEDDIYK